MLELNPNSRTCANSAIFVSGSGRSGTTIIGKLIHSLSSVEYIFEPPTLLALFTLIEIMPRDQWDYLYEAYLYEEFLINAMAGRSINTNRVDDSSIFAPKDRSEIEMRINKSWSKSELVEKAVNRRVAYKIPSLVNYVPELTRRYPEMTVVSVIRDATETIHSLLEKKWFKFNHPDSTLIWPFRIVGAEAIPHWVRVGEEALWCELSEIDRCAYYYICMSEGSDALDCQIVLKYSDLLTSPLATVERLANFIGVDFGEQTLSMIKTIKPTGKPLDRGIMGRISEQFRPRVVELSARAE